MASLLSAGTLPFEYLPLNTPEASGLQMVVPARVHPQFSNKATIEQHSIKQQHLLM